jgi:hypothetical protein
MKSVTFLAKIFIPFLLIIPKTGSAQSFTLQAGSGFMDVQYSSVVYADVDGDGDPDVLMTGANGGYTCTARMYINNGQGGYTLSTNTFSGVREGVSAFADIDGDGDQDLLITGGLQSGTAIAYLYTNNGSGIFTQVTNSNLVGVTRSTVVFADIDNDGDQDLFVAGSTSTGSVVSNLYANNGSGSFTLVNAGITGFTSSAAAFGDINGDGYKDLFVTGFSSSTNIESRLYLNNGATGGFTQVTTGVPEAVQSGSVLFADMDNDGDLDLMVVGADPIYAKVAKLYRNNGSGAFTLVPGTPFLGAQYGSVSVADVNNDGLKDVLITGYLNPNRRADLYINNGTSGFTLATGMPFIGVTNSSAAFADVDNDGDQDLWIVGQAATGVSSRLYFNNTVPCTTPVVHLGNDTMICAGSLAGGRIAVQIAAAWIAGIERNDLSGAERRIITEVYNRNSTSMNHNGIIAGAAACIGHDYAIGACCSNAGRLRGGIVAVAVSTTRITGIEQDRFPWANSRIISQLNEGQGPCIHHNCIMSVAHASCRNDH